MGTDRKVPRKTEIQRIPMLHIESLSKAQHRPGWAGGTSHRQIAETTPHCRYWLNSCGSGVGGRSIWARAVAGPWYEGFFCKLWTAVAPQVRRLWGSLAHLLAFAKHRTHTFSGWRFNQMLRAIIIAGEGLNISRTSRELAANHSV